MSDRSTEDLLSLVLDSYRLHASVFQHAHFCGPWAINTSGTQRATFHLVGRGNAWLHLGEGRAPRPLRGGDLVVMPHDAWHTLSGQAQLNQDSDADCGPEQETAVLCGYIDFGEGPANPVLDALPEVLVVRANDPVTSSRIDQLARLMLAEAETDAPGWQTAVNRLADVLFVHVIRHHLAAQGERRGWLAALADARLNKTLMAMHREPGQSWTVDGLAAIAGMSRSAFAQHFAALVGETPLAYLTCLRMREADRLLRDGSQSVAQVAERMGYGTEAAFRKAFKRVWGIGPGERRRYGVGGPLQRTDRYKDG